MDGKTQVKMTTKAEDGHVVSTVFDSIERLAKALQMDADEIIWAIEEHGQCDCEGAWPGQTATIVAVE